MDDACMKEVLETGNLIRQKVHDLNNLIMVVEGNMRMLQDDDGEIMCESLESLRECKEIIKSIFLAGCKLRSMGS